MKYTAGQAAKAVGVATSTITNALKSGKISGDKDENGAWRIDPAELHRVYPPIASKESESPSIEHGAIPEKGVENRGLERLVATLQEQIADLRGDRDHWRQQAERLSLLLPTRPANENPAPLPVIETPPPAPETGLLGRLWAALRGG